MSDIDTYSTTWRAVKALADESLGNAVGVLESHGIGMEATEFTRGRISAFRQVLELAGEQAPDGEKG